MDRQMINYLPRVLRDVRDFQCLMAIYQQAFKDLWQREGENQDNFYLETASERGLAHFERILGVTPRTGHSIEERRQLIRAQLSKTPPYCWNTLLSFLKDLTADPEAFSITLEGFTITLTLYPRFRWMADAVYHLVRQMIPANIALHLNLIFRTHRELGKHTHRKLNTHTHHALRTEVDLT